MDSYSTFWFVVCNRVVAWFTINSQTIIISSCCRRVAMLAYFSIRVIENNQTDSLAVKDYTNSKWFFQADISSKKRTNKFNFTTFRLVFVRFLEENDCTKKTFRNQLTFTTSICSRLLGFFHRIWKMVISAK